MTTRIASFLAFFFIAATATVQAQPLELGAHVVGAQWSEFEGADYGVGGRLSWKPSPSIGLEGELNWYP